VFESFLGVNPWTALFILLNTLTIYFVAKKFLFAPVMQMIEDRQKEIDDMYTDANTAKESAMALESAYKDKLSVATETGERIVKDAITRGQQREEEIIRQANADAAAIMDKAAASIAQEKKKAINEAKDEISGIAIAIAEKVVARQISSDDQQKLVDEFINGLGE
jgi:F-type H+-transporting ATPase subunit b